MAELRLDDELGTELGTEMTQPFVVPGSSQVVTQDVVPPQVAKPYVDVHGVEHLLFEVTALLLLLKVLKHNEKIIFSVPMVMKPSASLLNWFTRKLWYREDANTCIDGFNGLLQNVETLMQSPVLTTRRKAQLQADVIAAVTNVEDKLYVTYADNRTFLSKAQVVMRNLRISVEPLKGFW